jgi:hypothetical protein
VLALRLLAEEHRGVAVRARREVVLRAMRRVTNALVLTTAERKMLHREGYTWAVELGRWNASAIAALEARFSGMRDGLVALLATPCDDASEARWTGLVRCAGSSDAAIEQARRTIGHHANRLGVFAEAEAILHYFLFRIDSGPDEA